MQQLFQTLERAAKSDATVLIEGETGTGKEVSALAIHEHSQRHTGPFVVVDCGAIPGQLLESELFGYERGAFTGAVATRIGAFEGAHGGSVFLDEIGELGIDLQPKILRALEDRKVKRVGSNTYLPFNARVIAATNRSLRSEVSARRFRSDLYYRLAVVNIKLPPLRERSQDLPALVDEILAQLGLLGSSASEALRTPEFIEMLARYRWPGNVRQLRNYVERRVAMGDTIAPPGSDTSLPPPPAESSQLAEIDIDQPLRLAREAWNNVFEARYVGALLERYDNNVTAAAKAAGVNRVHFYRLLWKHRFREPDTSAHEGS